MTDRIIFFDEDRNPLLIDKATMIKCYRNGDQIQRKYEFDNSSEIYQKFGIKSLVVSEI